MSVLSSRAQSRSLQLVGYLLFVILAVSACKSHTAVALIQQKAAQPVAQQQVPTRVETGQEKSCREFVQRFYDWYFDRLNSESKGQSNSPNIDDVIGLKPGLLTVKLLQMLKEDRKAASKNPGEIVGLDFDPYINAQDWEGKYSVESATVNGGTCRVTVWGTDAGKKREMVDPELESDKGKWVFVNFHYPGSPDARNENLIAVLEGLREDRKHPHKDEAP